MFLVTKQLVENMVNEFLVQLMTGAVDRSDFVVAYESRDCVIVLHNKIPIMLRDSDARNFRKWYKAESAPATTPTKARPLNKPTAA